MAPGSPQSKNGTVVRKVAAAWRAGSGAKEMSPGYANTPALQPWWLLPAGYMDLERVGNGSGNSAVEACLNVLGNAFAEAPATVLEVSEGQELSLPQHPASMLLASPNEYMPGELLWQWTLTATHVEGDAYWFKSRSLAGAVRELWPLMPNMVEPRDGRGSLATPEEQAATRNGVGPFIAYYEYRVEGRLIRLERSDIVHFRNGINPDNPRKGRAPLRTVLREVLGDEEAGQFSAAMLRNMGVPGVVLTPADPDDPGPTADQADDIADAWEQRFGGSNRGRPLVMSGGRWQIDRVSFSPSEMDYGTLRRVPEERISAVLGVPAILAGLGAGLDRATYSNAGELREFFTEQKLAPLWRLYGAEVSLQLAADFGFTPTQRIGFDTSDVRALQTDEDKLFARWLSAVQAGAATVADFRRAVGLETSDADEVYLRSSTLFEVPYGETPEDRIPEPAQLEAVVGS